jgi:hypothetical protein
MGMIPLLADTSENWLGVKLDPDDHRSDNRLSSVVSTTGRYIYTNGDMRILGPFVDVGIALSTRGTSCRKYFMTLREREKEKKKAVEAKK